MSICQRKREWIHTKENEKEKIGNEKREKKKESKVANNNVIHILWINFSSMQRESFLFQTGDFAFFFLRLPSGQENMTLHGRTDTWQLVCRTNKTKSQQN